MHPLTKQAFNRLMCERHHHHLECNKCCYEEAHSMGGPRNYPAAKQAATSRV